MITIQANSSTFTAPVANIQYHSHYHQHAEHSIRKNRYVDCATTYSTIISGTVCEVELMALRSLCYIQSKSVPNRIYTISIEQNRSHRHANAYGLVIHCQCPAYFYNHTCNHIHAAQDAYMLVRSFVASEERQLRRSQMPDLEAWDDLCFREYLDELEGAQ